MNERLERGRKRRREVLGDAHVDHAEAATTPFMREFQELLTSYPWGEIWTRPGLDETTRRLLTIAMLVALNREEELRLHLRAAHDAGVAADTVKELASAAREGQLCLDCSTVSLDSTAGAQSRSAAAARGSSTRRSPVVPPERRPAP